MYDMPDVLLHHKDLTRYMLNVLKCEAIHKSLQKRHMYYCFFQINNSKTILHQEQNFIPPSLTHQFHEDLSHLIKSSLSHHIMN